MTDDVGETYRRWREAGESIAMATVIAIEGSVPRGPGAQLLVTARGEMRGSVSGGCVEGAVAQAALDVLAGAAPQVLQFGIDRDMMWEVGLACGGTIDVFVDSLDRGTPPSFERGVTQCTVVRGPHAGGRIQLRREPGGFALVGSTGDAGLDARLLAGADDLDGLRSPQLQTFGDGEVFVDPRTPDQRLVIVGAVHVAAALCAFATRAGFVVTVVDPREQLNDRRRFPDAAKLAIGWPEDELPHIAFDDDTYVAVLAHDEKFDDPTLAHALPSAARYVGAMGSRRTQAKRRARLLERGLAPEALDRLRGPIGLDIGADTPEEIAIAILAEMIAAKYEKGIPARKGNTTTRAPL